MTNDGCSRTDIMAGITANITTLVLPKNVHADGGVIHIALILTVLENVYVT